MSASSEFARRGFLAGAGVTAATPLFARGTEADASPRGGGESGEPTELHWLGGAPAAPTTTAWGVPWPRGKVSADTPFALTTADGDPVPVQSWPLAYWPDGTLKWSGHAVAAGAAAGGYRLAPGEPAAPDDAVRVSEHGDEIRLTNGTVEVRLGRRGPHVIRSVRRGERVTAENGRLALLVQDRPDGEHAEPRRTEWSGVVEEAEIEQRGPVRAVVKLSGRYRRDHGRNRGAGGRKMLPWSMRVYLASGDESMSLVHNVYWDADSEHVFVRGMGLRLGVPMTDDAHNRHIRFGTASGGVWGEPVRVLTGLRRDPGEAVRRAQYAGKATPPPAEWSEEVRDGYRELALWNDFALFQGSSEHFAVWKRTSSESSWLRNAGRGHRAAGFGYVGGASGGLGVGMHDFWRRFPRSLDIRGAAGDTATVTLWSYSPHGEAMDLRHYDTEAHGLGLAYEDVQEGLSSPEGIARSTEMRLWALDSTPSRERVVRLSEVVDSPPRLVAAPERYHRAGVFGRWSLPDRTGERKAELEDSLERDVAFYAGQVDQRQWYGFWDHGDVMHTYDGDRHEWRYDVGGYAWDNGELGTDAMLWYAFLRSGDPEAFRLARAMTKHLSEVDTHHTGRFAGLGSRHNVSHWGGGAKEARVSESFTKRFCYYLTADELLGELMRSSLRADRTMVRLPPLRNVLDPQDRVPTRLRIGPDWYALVSNWMTEWERTGDTRWRDRIVTGMRDIAGFPAGLFTGEAGGAVGFDPETAHLTNLGKGDYEGGYNLSMAFCGEQILWEALDLVDVPEFRRTLLEFARYVQAPAEEKIDRFGFDFDPGVFGTIYSRVTAWAGEQLDEPWLRRRGWQRFTSDPNGRPWPEPVRVDGAAVASPVDEIPTNRSHNQSGDFAVCGTNDAAQRGLAIISLLAIAPDEAP
ncbi:hypothetical protein CDG81_11915 [Actinopolyspora erythraea]|uniref:Tat pathway signal sequence domain protein n=1 Tax=Actinopolyspora erythraea TaxID=414996 RepID=A0A099D761_9ACTN|nr:hypothetical protein [Actinopolyspora erythraea]ASU78870.1 hypothetical protein CDG81_11915 [Actinopolyspora erythraea]KGI81220.1 hypothetical protein IL38_11995 [Actinopolyspora erythraea]